MESNLFRLFDLIEETYLPLVEDGTITTEEQMILDAARSVRVECETLRAGILAKWETLGKQLSNPPEFEVE